MSLDTAFSLDLFCTKCVAPVLSVTTTLSGMTLTYGGSATYADTAYWDFGDGTTSLVLSGSHTFTPGNYDVCFKGINACEADSTCLHLDLCNYAAFGVSDSIICPDDTLFTINSTAPAASFTWLLDGVPISSSYDTLFTLSSGSGHTLSLIANDGVCLDTVSRTISVSAPPLLSDLVADTTICAGDSVFLSPAGGPFSGYDWSTGASTPLLEEALSPGTYGVTIYNSDGCPFSDSFSISFSPDPGDFVPDTSFCAGRPLSLSLPGFGSYAWSGGGTSAIDSIFLGGSHSVTVTDAIGCAFSDSFWVYDSEPLFSSSYLGGTIVSFTNLSVGAMSLLWDFGDGSPFSLLPNPIHGFPTSGTYWVCLTITDSLGNNCSHCDSVDAFVVVSQNHSSVEGLLTVHPNPVTGQEFVITSQYYIGDASHISILNFLGEDISSSCTFSRHDNEWLVYCPAMPKGVYLVRVEEPTWQATQKIWVR
jgi:hypothetical protein